MKKATRIIIILLAIATLLAIYWPESDVGNYVNNSVVKVQQKADNVAEKADDMIDDMGENIGEEIDEIEDTIDDMMEDGKDMVEDGVDAVVEGGAAVVEEGKEMLEDGKDMVEDGVDAVVEGGAAVVEEGKEMLEDGVDAVVDAVDISNNGYYEYNAEDVKDALEDGKNVALFFHATWCPSCAALDENLSTNAEALSEDTMIYKVDFDSSDELKAKYNVSSQHTVVYLDKDMNAVEVSKDVQTYEDLEAGFAQ